MADVINNLTNTYYQKDNHIRLSKSEMTRNLVLDAAVTRAANLGKTIAATARGAVAVFDPATLSPVLWHDPSASTSFLSTNNPTPASATEAVGFQLDKSQGAGYSGGSFTGLSATQEVSNGTFDTDTTGWSVYRAAVLTVETGRMKVAGSGTTFPAASQTLSLVVGKTYLLQGDYDLDGSATQADLNVGTAIGGGQMVATTSTDASGSVEAVFTATTTTAYLSAYGGSGPSQHVFWDNISVRELPGFQGTQSNSSFRPLLQTTPDRLVYDGIDDRLTTTLNPTTTGSIAARFRGGTASRIAVGSQGATDGRAYIGLASDGSAAGGVGTQATATIKGSTDQRGEWVTVTLTWNGTTVTLYENGVEVYSAAQSGAVNTTIPFTVGALNANGTATAFWDDDISNVIITDDVITAAEAASLHTLWSA